MSELDDIKRKKLEELKRLQQEKVQGQLEEEAQVQQQVQQLESIVKNVFTKEALERYGNLKAAHPDKAVQLLVVLAQVIQSGQINKVDDAQLKNILMKLTPEKKKFKIRFFRKFKNGKIMKKLQMLMLLLQLLHVKVCLSLIIKRKMNLKEIH